MTRYALGFRDGRIPVRRVADDEEIARFHTPGGAGFCVFAFSHDGRYLAAAQFSGEALSVWDVDRRVLVASDPGPVRDRVRFSPDGRLIALARAGGDLMVYDLATGRAGERARLQPRDPDVSASTRPGSRSCRTRIDPPAESSRRGPAGSSGRSRCRRRGGGRLEPRRLDAVRPPARTAGSTSGTPRQAPGGRSSTGISAAGCARRSTPPARCWAAAAGKAGPGSGTRSWAGPGST